MFRAPASIALLAGALHGAMQALVFETPPGDTRRILMFLMLLPLLSTSFVYRPALRTIALTVLFAMVLDFASEWSWRFRICYFPASYLAIFIEAAISWSLVGVFQGTLFRIKMTKVAAVAVVGFVFGLVKSILMSAVLMSLFSAESYDYDDEYDTARLMFTLLSPVVGLFLLTVPIEKELKRTTASA
ncbi:MAG TPA: hypothetical protein VEJ63_03680 [Planctomycetota bacterium]|nr:hypothetical protein [Planctomycetota bacterium]